MCQFGMFTTLKLNYQNFNYTVITIVKSTNTNIAELMDFIYISSQFKMETNIIQIKENMSQTSCMPDLNREKGGGEYERKFSNPF